MHNTSEKLYIYLNRITDAILVVISFFLAFKFREGLDFDAMALFDENISDYWWLVLTIVIIWWYFLFFCKVYKSYRGKPVYNVIKAIIKANILGLLCLTFVLFIFKKLLVHRTLILLFFIFCTVLLIVGKVVLYHVLERVRASKLNTKYALIIGTGQRTVDLIGQFKGNPGAGFKIIGILGDNPEMVGQTIGDEKIVGHYSDLLDFLRHETIDEVFITIPISRLDEIRKMIFQCEQYGINASVMAYIHNPVKATMYMDEVLKIPFISFTTRPVKIFQLYLKGMMDILISAFGLIISFPILLIVSVAIKLESRGPVFFKQERVGMNGRKFTMYKFRSMVECAQEQRNEMDHCNELDGPAFKMKCDPRVTEVGKFIRKWSIDELPQLLNVLKRQMSIVGPRPLPTYEANKITGPERRRNSMLPGITGIWQVSGRNELDFETWMKMDLWYIDNWSLWLDVKIIVKTTRVLILAKGAY